MLVEGSHVPMGQENHQFVSQSVSDVAVGQVDLDLSLDSFGFGDLLQETQRNWAGLDDIFGIVELISWNLEIFQLFRVVSLEVIEIQLSQHIGLFFGDGDQSR